MKSDYLKRKKGFLRDTPFATDSGKEFISIVLLGFSVLFAVLILFRIAGVFVLSAKAQKSVKSVLARNNPEPNDMEQYFDKPKSIAEKLKENNLFAPPEPEKHPVNQVSGILGNEVLIDGKWYKVGDKIKDAKIVAIEPARIRVEWQGKEKTFSPIEAVSAAEPKGKKEKPDKERKRRKKRAVGEEPKEKKMDVGLEQDPLAWMGVKLSAALRAKLLERWNEMSDEQKQQWKEQWNSVSDEQKQQMVNSMEENIDKI